LREAPDPEQTKSSSDSHSTTMLWRIASSTARRTTYSVASRCIARPMRNNRPAFCMSAQSMTTVSTPISSQPLCLFTPCNNCSFHILHYNNSTLEDKPVKVRVDSMALVVHASQRSRLSITPRCLPVTQM
jgi:hypothetical protein